jgi:molybdopterin-guanine dinucleotide biosynthesis protein A
VGADPGYAGTPPSPGGGQTPAAAPLAALVLAGGRSTRMQRDKATLEYAGEPQLARAVRLVRTLVPDAYVSVRADQLDDPARRAYPKIVDGAEGTGPAAGILAAQAARPECAWLVVAVDLPLLDEPTLRRLLSARDPTKLATAYASAHDGLPEPLCAVWEPASAAPLRAFVAGGRTCPRKFLITHGAALLPLERADALDNVNTPDEYALALRPRSESR